MYYPPTLKKILVYSALYLFTAALIASVVFLAPNQQDNYPLFRDFIIIFATTLLTKYFIYMAVSPWYTVKLARMRKRFQRIRTAPYLPRVSVIIPAWNEEVGLLNTVKTVLLSTYTNLEVVVINDGSTDGSDRIMREFMAQYASMQKPGKVGVIYRYKENGGKGSALNKGIELSSGEIIVSIDADCALLPDTISNFVAHFEDPKVMAAVGNVKIGNTQHLLGTLQYLEFLFSFYCKKADSLLGTIYIIGGAAGAFRREVFERIGNYSQHNITEDIDLSVRIQEAGMRIVYAADAVVYTEGAATLASLTQQRLRWKRGRFQTFSEHRDLFFSSKSGHNKILTHLVLPLAVFGDVQLFFELMFLAFLYAYSFMTHDFSSFISGILVVSSIFAFQMFDDTSQKRFSFYLLAPIGWLLFYVTTVVEYRALINSIKGMVGKKKLKWQRWERNGLELPNLGRPSPINASRSQ